jgi:hypothetical protein
VKCLKISTDILPAGEIVATITVRLLPPKLSWKKNIHSVKFYFKSLKKFTFKLLTNGAGSLLYP